MLVKTAGRIAPERSSAQVFRSAWLLTMSSGAIEGPVNATPVCHTSLVPMVPVRMTLLWTTGTRGSFDDGCRRTIHHRQNQWWSSPVGASVVDVIGWTVGGGAPGNPS